MHIPDPVTHKYIYMLLISVQCLCYSSELWLKKEKFIYHTCLILTVGVFSAHRKFFINSVHSTVLLLATLNELVKLWVKKVQTMEIGFKILLLLFFIKFAVLCRKSTPLWTYIDQAMSGSRANMHMLRGLFYVLSTSEKIWQYYEKCQNIWFSSSYPEPGTTSRVENTKHCDTDVMKYFLAKICSKMLFPKKLFYTKHSLG